MANPPALEQYTDSDNKEFLDLQYAVHKLLKARNALEKPYTS